MKRLVHDGAKALTHIAAPVVRDESVVAEITRAEYTAHDLIDIDYTRELASFGANPVNEVRSGLQAFEVIFKFFGSPWRSCPMPVEFPAASHSS